MSRGLIGDLKLNISTYFFTTGYSNKSLPSVF